MLIGWVITKDLISGGASVGMGVSNTPADKLVKHKKARAFRMLDDDNEVYYEGVIVTDEAGTEQDFAPLDDFGMPVAGCTMIQYQTTEGWEIL